MSKHPWACVCRGTGTIESGPAGATHTDPCPGPPGRVDRWGWVYVRDDIHREIVRENERFRTELASRDDVIYTAGKALGRGDLAEAQRIIAEYEERLRSAASPRTDLRTEEDR